MNQHYPRTWRQIFRESWKGLLSLVCFNLILAGTGYRIFDASVRIADTQNFAKVTNVAQALGQSLNKFAEVIDLLHSLAVLRSRFAVSGNDAARSAIEEELRSVSSRKESLIFQVTIIDSRGYAAWSSSNPDSRVWLGDRTHFLVHKQGRKEPFVSEPVFGRVSGRWSLQFTRPIFGPDQIFDGVVVVSVDPFQLGAITNELAENGGDVIGLVRNQDGLVLATNQGLEDNLRSRRSVNLGPLINSVSKAQGVAFDSVLVPDQDRYLGYGALASWPITVLVSMNRGVLLADVRKFQLTGGLLIGAVSVCSIIVLLWSIQGKKLRENEKHVSVTEARLLTANLAKEEFDQLLTDVNTVIYTQRVPALLPRELTFFGPNAKRVLGLETGNQTSVDNLLVADDQNVLRQMQIELMRTGRAHAEYRLCLPDGQTIWISDRASLVRQPGVDNQRIVGTIDDVTERHALVERAAAESRLAILGQMTSSLGHELSQPIAVIGLATENIIEHLEGADAEKERLMPRLLKIRRQVERARDIMSHLRRFSHPGEKTLVPLDIADVIASSVALSKASLKDSNVELHVQIESNLPHVLASLTLAEQVIINIISNACDAFEGRPKSGRELRIDARADADGRNVSISFRDNAGGIPNEYLPKIFDFFYTSKASGKGTGLGLSLSRNYMQSMGGELMARNIADGAEFTMQFALQPRSE